MISIAALILLHTLLLRIDSKFDQRFADSWSKAAHSLPPEVPIYLEVEMKAFSRLTLLPGFGFASLPSLTNIHFAMHDLETLDITKRWMSLAETFGQVIFQTGRYATQLKPAGFDLKTEYERSRNLPPAFSLDMRLAPNAGISSIDTTQYERVACHGPTTHIYPFDQLVSMEVDWTPKPIHIGTVSSKGAPFVITMVIRDMPISKMAPLKAGRRVPAGCIMVHQSPDAVAVLLDIVSIIPSRSYMYKIDYSEEPNGPLRLTADW